MAQTASATVQIDNEQVRVTEWRFAPGAQTGWHVHQMDYIVVPLLDGRLRIDNGETQVESPMFAGKSYNRPAGVSHNVINANEFEYAFVEVELKAAPVQA